MMKVFRSSMLLYFGLIILGVLLVIPFFVTIETMDGKIFPLGSEPLQPVSAVLILVIWVLISALIATRRAAKLSARIVRLYTQECDPYTYIDKYEKILKRWIGNARNYVLLNLSSGYLATENLQKAKQTLDSVGKLSNKKAGLQNQVVYYNNLCAYFLQLNDIASAEKMLESMLGVLRDKKFSKLQYDYLYNYYIGKQYCINLAKGNYVGAEEVFLIQFNREKSKLGKVVAKYQLGIIYFNLKRIEEALEAFEYVVNNGNKTYYVGKSIDFINQCSGAV